MKTGARRLTTKGRRVALGSAVGLKLPSPERCRHCKERGRVVDSRAYDDDGYRWRRHECAKCNWRWSSYQSMLNPKKVRFAR